MSRLRYLLDTNVVSDLLRRPRGAVAAHIAHVGQETICTSIVVACELRYGAAKAKSAKLSERLNAALALLPVLPLDRDADREYGELRSLLERRGRTIGPNDLLIAAQALFAGLTVVTGNTREFERVPGLAVVNWLEGRPMAPPSVQENKARYRVKARSPGPRAAAPRKKRARRAPPT